MRQFIDGNGNDATTTVRAFLAQNRQLHVADLFQLQTLEREAPWSTNLLLTTADRPLTWNRVGTFVPARLRRGEIESKIGLEVTSLDLEWYLQPQPQQANTGPIGDAAADMLTERLSMLQSFERGLWDNGTLRLWRTIMPVFGDCNSFGACELFAGRIAELSMTRLGVKIQANCPLELLDQQIPSNLIQPGNPTAEYGPGEAPPGLASAPQFEVQAGSSASIIIAGCIGPTPHQLFAADTFDFGYLLFTAGMAQGQMATVRRSDQYAGSNRFYLYEPLPVVPVAGDTFEARVPAIRNQNAGSYQGFPYLPAPEATI